MRHLVLILVAAALAGGLSAQQGWRLETSNAPWAPRTDHNAIVFNNEHWIFGGLPAAAADAWTTSDGVNWNFQASFAGPPVVMGSVLLELNGELWALGGSRGSYVSRSADGIDWIHKPDAPWPGRSYPAGVAFNGKLWVFGGETRQNPYVYDLNDVWSSPDGVNWTQEVAAAAWPARDAHSAVVFNNRMWILGGRAFVGGKKNDVWSSSDGVNWVEETASAPWEPRSGHRTVVYRDRLWVIGGGGEDPAGQNELCDDAWSSDDGVNWVKETDGAPWGERGGHGTVVFNDRIWLTGGLTSAYKNDVWSYGLHIAPDGISDAVVDQVYHADFEAREGDGPFDWTLLSSQLPPGMTLDTTTTSDSVYLHGTPTETGEYPFTLQLEDADGHVTEQEYTLTVIPPPSNNSNGASGSAGTGCTAAPGGLPWLILYGTLTLTGAVILRRRVVGA